MKRGRPYGGDGSAEYEAAIAEASRYNGAALRAGLARHYAYWEHTYFGSEQLSRCELAAVAAAAEVEERAQHAAEEAAAAKAAAAAAAAVAATAAAATAVGPHQASSAGGKAAAARVGVGVDPARLKAGTPCVLLDHESLNTPQLRAYIGKVGIVDRVLEDSAGYHVRFGDGCVLRVQAVSLRYAGNSEFAAFARGPTAASAPAALGPSVGRGVPVAKGVPVAPAPTNTAGGTKPPAPAHAAAATATATPATARPTGREVSPPPRAQAQAKPEQLKAVLAMAVREFPPGDYALEGGWPNSAAKAQAGPPVKAVRVKLVSAGEGWNSIDVMKIEAAAPGSRVLKPAEVLRLQQALIARRKYAMLTGQTSSLGPSTASGTRDGATKGS